MSLHPQSPSPGPDGRNASARQSLGPNSARGSLTPGSPRIGARPTSELLGSAGMYQTPETEALDAWFENLQSYEKTLEEMAAASLDVNFKEELSAIEQWFKVLSEAERTAALYSLLQHSSQVQIRFFITVLQQMARSDPLTAMLSPAMGGSMQAQMDAKLATLKSPSLKSTFPPSPTTRNFAGNRQSLTLDSTSNFLSPDSAAQLASPSSGNDAASTLAAQRAKLKASNASHRISAPVLASPSADRGGAWGSASLGQVNEQNGAATQEPTRPKSTDFASVAAAAAAANENPNNEATLPARDSWASMVNTPLIPMFQKQNPQSNLEAANNKLNDWKQGGGGGPSAPGVPRMGDPTIHRMVTVVGTAMLAVLLRSITTSNQMGLGMQMGGFNPMMGNPNMGMGHAQHAQHGAMGISPEAQLLAAQMAASGAFGQQGGPGGPPPGFFGMPPNSAGLSSAGGNRRPPKSAGLRSATSTGSSAPKGEDDVDPSLLHDIPSWLRSLRLHKYTPNFEGMNWQDMVVMDDAQLEAKGVAALGARRKMLKTFEVVRKKMNIEGGPSSPPP
ncbi:hypothetical protein DL96DRAFT_1698105 [Flagelloscypha sp. PMI_526]|nr:hypothetical protein DL96DRAFT_1698105 [Flagelloscypha sp. PMI_526]